MFFHRIQKAIKFPTTFITMLVLVFGFFCMGLFHKMPMPMEGMGATSMVSMQSDPSCCGMGISQHIDSWKLISQSIPRDARDILILLALGVVAFFTFWRLPLNYKLSDLDFIRYRAYLRLHPDLLSFHHLKLAFARGILNTKIY